MTGHVAEGAGAEVPPAPPLEVVVGAACRFPPPSAAPLALRLGRVERPVRPVRGRTEELVPMHAGRDRGLRRPLHDGRGLRPNRAVGPDVGFLDRPEYPGLDD